MRRSSDPETFFLYEVYTTPQAYEDRENSSRFRAVRASKDDIGC